MLFPLIIPVILETEGVVPNNFWTFPFFLPQTTFLIHGLFFFFSDYSFQFEPAMVIMLGSILRPSVRFCHLMGNCEIERVRAVHTVPKRKGENWQD